PYPGGALRVWRRDLAPAGASLGIAAGPLLAVGCARPRLRDSRLAQLPATDRRRPALLPPRRPRRADHLSTCSPSAPHHRPALPTSRLRPHPLPHRNRDHDPRLLL